MGKQAVSLPCPAQSGIVGVGVLAPAAPARSGGGSDWSCRLVNPRWAPPPCLVKAAKLHGPAAGPLLALGAMGRNVGRGPNVVACSRSLGPRG